ncbi:TlpA family protein disulfide reductase [Algoriphagus sp. AGSA1]|uniref:TlpA family protein disulfide reductase n=1 Tax=unclassified Algoriphagus TaxID=2641541 RepID=UPI00178737BE|nr:MULTISPECIES: TlpA disulfide reductase family protein [unclassified Algoriphagus]MCE7057583.1 TlpA family protein disulfide reductase [Algoriphagus sp. AGSA1]
MKKHILICLVGLLCLPTSTLLAQVADSPGADFLHRSVPQVSPEHGDTHRGGNARPDTLPENSSLVDHFGTQGQESESSSASVGEALIYGEIINPDSLGPIRLTVTPYYLDPKSSFMRKESTIDPQRGEFFDGVMNKRTMKFLAELSLGKRTGYFTLSIDGWPILENYLVHPGDSLMLSLNLRLMEVLFAGSDAAFYEAQYMIKREQKRRAFASPRQLVAQADSRMLQDPDNQAKIAKYKGAYGAELLIFEPGTESLEYLMNTLGHPEEALQAQITVLNGFSDQLSNEEFDLLEAKIYSDFYAGGFSTYRKFYHPQVERQFSEDERLDFRNRMQVFVEKAEAEEYLQHTRLISDSYLMMSLEISILKSLWEEESFLEIVSRDHTGEVADRLRAGYLSNYLSALSGQEEKIQRFLEVTSVSPWRERIVSLEKSHVPGDSILPIRLSDLQGNNYTRGDLLGKPTLLYFYFSSCAHSATYFKEYLFPLYGQTKELGYELVAVSVDRDKEFWKSHIDQYSDSTILNLNLSGKDKQRWISYYEIYGYPKTMLLDEQGRIVSFDIRELGTDYQSFHDNFLKLYQEEISHSPFSVPNL